MYGFSYESVDEKLAKFIEAKPSEENTNVFFNNNSTTRTDFLYLTTGQVDKILQGVLQK